MHIRDIHRLRPLLEYKTACTIATSNCPIVRSKLDYCNSVACRGCWMPEANEVLGCPRKYFLFTPQTFRRPFLSVFKFQDNSLPGCLLPSDSRAASCPGNDIFLFIFAIYLHFLHKTGPLDAPQGGCPGPSHRPHPLCTPLQSG